MMDGEYNCQLCKRSGCLKEEVYVKLTNVPTSCFLHDRIVLLNRENFWIYFDILTIYIPVRSSVLSYIETFLGICPKSILDFRVNQLISRYFYCRDYNVQPFPGTYDDQPAEWIYLSNVITSELNVKREEVYKSQIKQK